jgi:ferredoxin
MMRIIHDESRCASLGMCEAVAPELFEVGADGELRLLDPTPGAHLRALAEEAVAACPTGALAIEG